MTNRFRDGAQRVNAIRVLLAPCGAGEWWTDTGPLDAPCRLAQVLLGAEAAAENGMLAMAKWMMHRAALDLWNEDEPTGGLSLGVLLPVVGAENLNLLASLIIASNISHECVDMWIQARGAFKMQLLVGRAMRPCVDCGELKLSPDSSAIRCSPCELDRGAAAD